MRHPSFSTALYHCSRSALASQFIVSAAPCAVWSCRFPSICNQSRHQVSFVNTRGKMTSTNQANTETNSHPPAEADHDNAPKESKDRKTKKGPPKKRDTHFLCFPLVTDTSVPQLANSLQYFRDVTTKPSTNTKAKLSREEDESASADQPPQLGEEDPLTTESNTSPSHLLPPSNPDLQILPAIAHRPPGTFHLTLGVMDLSQQEEMDRALKLLQELDYADILSKTIAHDHEQAAGSSQNRSIPLRSSDAPNEQTALSSLERPVSPPPAASGNKNDLGFSRLDPPRVSLTGLSTFPSSKSSRVFFAKPCPTPPASFPLLKFGQALRQKFREAGFITETRPLVLHATLANMRYATQAKGGRTSKGRTWRYGKDRWKDGQVDARELITLFDVHNGETETYTKGSAVSDEERREFVWANDIVLNRVAICKMGAEKSDDEVLGMVYPPVGEKMIFA